MSIHVNENGVIEDITPEASMNNYGTIKTVNYITNSGDRCITAGALYDYFRSGGVNNEITYEAAYRKQLVDINMTNPTVIEAGDCSVIRRFTPAFDSDTKFPLSVTSIHIVSPYNLAEVTYNKTSGTTRSGVTIKYDSNGYITLNGTATAAISHTYMYDIAGLSSSVISSYLNYPKFKIYHMDYSGSFSGTVSYGWTGATTAAAQTYWTTASGMESNGIELIVNSNSSTTAYWGLYIAKGASFSNYKFRPYLTVSAFARNKLKSWHSGSLKYMLTINNFMFSLTDVPLFKNEENVILCPLNFRGQISISDRPYTESELRTRFATIMENNYVDGAICVYNSAGKTSVNSNYLYFIDSTTISLLPMEYCRLWIASGTSNYFTRKANRYLDSFACSVCPTTGSGTTLNQYVTLFRAGVIGTDTGRTWVATFD